MDVTPLIPAGRHIVQAYGQGRFRISGTVIAGSALVTPSQSCPWPVVTMQDVTPQTLQSLFEMGVTIRLLLLGCGPRLIPAPTELRALAKAHGASIEAMDTGAACRTYNVLLSEDREVAAALIAV